VEGDSNQTIEQSPKRPIEQSNNRTIKQSNNQTIEQRIRDFVSQKTHLNFKAFEVVFIDKIPKNESGKTLYAQLPA